MNLQQNYKNDNMSRVSMLVLLTVICLIPFLNKAVHMDDPLFVWAGRQIQSDPFDPYGFDVNWYGTSMPMHKVTQNPPMASYYMALTASLFGWSEPALHSAFILPAILFIIGTYYLAAYFCSRPFDAALITLLAPVVLLSSTTLMCDLLMLAFWVWAVLLWMKGILEDKKSYLLFAALLVTCSALTKYFGMNLILLLFVWTVAERRRLDSSLLLLLVPVAILAVYHWATTFLYGSGLLFAAASYAKQVRIQLGYPFLSKILTGLAFTGGCFLTMMFYVIPWFRKKPWLILQGTLAAATAVLLFKLRTIGNMTLIESDTIRLGYLTQFVLYVLAGTNLLVITLADLHRSRDAKSLLLTLWVFGTFLFAVLINWSVNGRTLLPLAPALGILAVRRIEMLQEPTGVSSAWKRYLTLVPAAALAVLAVYADYDLANTIRRDARSIAARYQSASNTVWFQGHWGFQYYMELLGCKPFDVRNPAEVQGDIIVQPLRNTNPTAPKNATTSLRAVIDSPTLPWFSCMNYLAGAGFYTDLWGALPFVFGSMPPERYRIHLVVEAKKPAVQDWP